MLQETVVMHERLIGRSDRILDVINFRLVIRSGSMECPMELGLTEVVPLDTCSQRKLVS